MRSVIGRVEVPGESGMAQFFQTDRDGNPKGIVVIDPTQEEWS